MWSDPYMAQLVAIEHRNDAMEREKKNRLLREISDPTPSQNIQQSWSSFLKQLCNPGSANQQIRIGRQVR